jgi:hypothetical protein
MIFVFDKANSSVDPDLGLVGWVVDGFKGESQTHTYLINNSTYSRFAFDIYVKRAATTSMVMLFLPAALLVFVSLLSLLLKGQRLSNRITLNGTMLLAAILLHLRIAANLPTRSYFTFADQFMISTYVLLVMALVSSVLLAFFTENGDQRRAEFVYRYSLVAMLIFSVVIYFIILAHLYS